MSLTPIETHYKGYKFRSRLEARWAYVLDNIGWKWEYEPEGYDLGIGLKYLPDFVLLAKNKQEASWNGSTQLLFIEVKPNFPSGKELEKARMLAIQSKIQVVFAVGTPEAVTLNSLSGFDIAGEWHDDLVSIGHYSCIKGEIRDAFEDPRDSPEYHDDKIVCEESKYLRFDTSEAKDLIFPHLSNQCDVGENWPDPNNPGVPLSPKKSGWHWVAFPRTKVLTAMEWSSIEPLNCWVTSYLPRMLLPEEIAEFNYVGPIPYPSGYGDGGRPDGYKLLASQGAW